MEFSIIIPSWNNLPYLKLCIASIRQNSFYNHEIVLHLNESKDASLDWAIEQDLKFTFSDHNIGICKAVNQAFDKTTKDFIVYMNDDTVSYTHLTLPTNREV